MNEQANRERLAKMVTAARLRKFKTVDRARMAAEVARGTWEKVERGEAVKDFSLAAIEEALEWPEGQAQAILDGTDGAVLDDATLDAAGEVTPPNFAEMLRELQERQRVLEQEVEELRRARPDETA